MSIRNLCLALAVFATACATFSPRPPADAQRVYAGEETKIRLAEAPPEGAELRWDPGDGSGPLEGPIFRHRYQAAGTYRVKVEGSGGVASFDVEVEPRPVLRAVPADVSFAAVSDVDGMRDGAEASRLMGLGEPMEEFEKLLGASLDDPASLREIGIDPAEGVALVAHPADRKAIWMLLGIESNEKAAAFAQRIFRMETAGAVLPEQLTFGVNERGETIAWGLTGGYLAVRIGEGEGAEAGFAALKEAEASPLSTFEPFLRSRALTPGGDFLLWIGQSTNDLEIRAVVAGDYHDDGLELRFGVPLHDEELQKVASIFRQAGERPASLALYPRGAAALLSLSVDLRALWEVSVEEVERKELERMFREETGGELADFLAHLTGNGSFAVFLDRAWLGKAALQIATGGSPDVPPMIGSMELAKGKQPVAALRQALASEGAKLKRGVYEMDEFLFTVEEGLARVANAEARELLSRKGERALVEAIGEPMLVDAGEQLLYLDVAAVIDALLQAEFEGLDMMERAAMRALLSSQLERMRPIRSLTLRVRFDDEALHGSGRFRYRSDFRAGGEQTMNETP